MKKLAKNTAIILCLAFMATAIQLCSTGCKKAEPEENIYCTDQEAANYYGNLPCSYLSPNEKLTRGKWSIYNVKTEYYISGSLTTTSDSATEKWTIQFFNSGNFFEFVNGTTYQGQWHLSGDQLTIDQWTYDDDHIKMKSLIYRFRESWIVNNTLYGRHTIFQAIITAD